MRRTRTLTAATVLLITGAAMAQQAAPAPEDLFFEPGDVAVEDGQRGERRRGGAERRERGARGEGRRGGLPPEVKAALTAQFDTNQDGTLSRDEIQEAGEAFRTAAKAAMEEHKAAIVAQFDTDGDGELNETERTAAREAKKAEREARRAELLEQYDADGSGRLDREEIEQAVADGAMPERQRGRRGGRGGKGDRGGFGGGDDNAGQRARRGGRGLSPEQLAEFDLDGDGLLGDTEREQARVQMRQRFESRRAQAIEEFDSNGDGELTGAERDAARAAMKARVAKIRALRSADLDGDGAISAEELIDAGVRIAEGDPKLDVNADGIVDDGDFDALVNEVDTTR
ncbi:MAG: hypothetical protein AAFX05_03110 [Planctomycetota bacterium]